MSERGEHAFRYPLNGQTNPRRSEPHQRLSRDRRTASKARRGQSSHDTYGLCAYLDGRAPRGWRRVEWGITYCAITSGIASREWRQTMQSPLPGQNSGQRDQEKAATANSLEHLSY